MAFNLRDKNSKTLKDSRHTYKKLHVVSVWLQCTVAEEVFCYWSLSSLLPLEALFFRVKKLCMISLNSVTLIFRSPHHTHVAEDLYPNRIYQRWLLTQQTNMRTYEFWWPLNNGQHCGQIADTKSYRNNKTFNHYWLAAEQ